MVNLLYHGLWVGYSKLTNGLIAAASGAFSIQITLSFLVKPKEILLRSSRGYIDFMMQNLKLFPAMFQKKLFFRLPQCNEDMHLYEGSETPFFEIKIMFWVQV